MPYNLLLLPLLGGYCFVHFCYYFRFRSQRLDGYRLLIESAIAGLALVLVSRGLVCVLRGTYLSAFLKSHWDSFSPFPYSATASGAVLLGLALPFFVNLFCNESCAKNKILRRHGNALLTFLHNAARLRKPIAVTLESRKWYMGYVRDSPNLDPQEQYFALIPILSGYRDSQSLVVKQTVFYEMAYRHGEDRNDFAITIPLNSVKSAHFFKQDVYERFFATKRRSPRRAETTKKEKTDPSPNS